MRNYFSSFLLILSFGLTAQNNIFSPYSYYGIGLPAPQNGAFSQTMGGIGQGIGNSVYINTANPASYSANQKVNFEFNLFGTLSTLHDSSGFYDNKTYNFGRMNLAFPLGRKKNAGACFGLAPYSFAGYDMQRKFNVPTPHTDYYNGKGGVNKLFLGSGYSFNKHISIGANINYLFGDISSQRVTTFDTASLNNYFLENRTIVRGVTFDIGLQFRHYKDHVRDSVKYRKADSVYVNPKRHKSDKDSMIHIKRFGIKADRDTVTLVFCWGVTVTPGSNINATRDVYGVTFKDYYLPFSSKSIYVKDTVKYSVDETGKIVLPGSLAAGFTLSNFHKSDHRNNFLVGADFTYCNWSSYLNYGNSDSLHKSYSVKVGGYYKPAKPYRTDYFNAVEYRLGGHYTRTPIIVRGTAINEYGVSLGFGLPMSFKSHSSGVINLGFELGKMGSLENNLTTDTYIKLSIGLNLISDQWFQPYKYD